MVILDTTVLIDYLTGAETRQTAWLDRELGHQSLGLTDLILCEVLQGVRGEAAFRRVRAELEKFELLSMGGEQLAVASARNYRTLRARGITVRKTIDCLIATFCMMEGHTLLHNDRDYDAFESVLGLRVIHP